jgi:hypothetical protein
VVCWREERGRIGGKGLWTMAERSVRVRLICSSVRGILSARTRVRERGQRTHSRTGRNCRGASLSSRAFDLIRFVVLLLWM